MLWLLVNVLYLEIYYYLQRQSMILGLFDGPFLPVSTAANAFEAPGQRPWFDRTLQLFCELTRGVQDLNSWCSDQRWSGGPENSGDWWGWWYSPARDSMGSYGGEFNHDQTFLVCWVGTTQAARIVGKKIRCLSSNYTESTKLPMSKWSRGSSWAWMNRWPPRICPRRRR